MYAGATMFRYCIKASGIAKMKETQFLSLSLPSLHMLKQWLQNT